MHSTLPCQSANNWCKPVGEAHTSDNEQTEDIVHEAGCRQFVRAIVPYHKRIGKPHYDGAHLAHHNRHADTQQVGIVR